MYFDEFKAQLPDTDPTETAEWLESLDDVVASEGIARARFLMFKLLKRSRQLHVGLPALTQTRYINTISPEQEPGFPGDEQLERRIRRLIRWNAVAMVLRANTRYPGIGGHLSTYASSASLYEVGFNWFFRGKDEGPGDRIFYQGHAAPGMYARAFLEGRLSEDQLDHFRREVVRGQGLPSYPHPRLMPDFWEYPTVSMGLGPLSAVYQARFDRYLLNRGLADTRGTRVWAFLGDGEMDEPEALAGLSLAAREGLDNLTFVVNCNLQRLDGPVRGNGKIIQELEGLFRGAGWNVIKVIWSRDWDPLLARDTEGVLVDRMNETLDGEFQKLSVSGGGYIREHFFGPDPRLRRIVEDLDDDALARLRRGGHDYRKLYAAYKAATEYTGAPTVILAKTIKGWTLGAAAEGRNVTHQVKKLSEAELRVFRDRLELPIPDAALKEAPYFHPGPDSEEVRYMLERRRALGGSLPKRIVRHLPLAEPAAKADAEFAAGSATPVSTTMAFAKLLRNLIRDEAVGPRIVPIIPDEARTFGMDPLFKEVGIYAALGQRYEPVDSDLVLSYREATNGQVLEEGINEAGSMASLQAAGTAYATQGVAMVPFYIFYSMFGFQRTGDQAWAFGDARGRGFLMGATAGRTTLHGEGLQHDDGHSQLLASTIPNVRAYDPAYAYELAAIVRDGIRRMYVEDQDVFYYVTIHNENQPMPPKPDGVDEGILRGIYRLHAAPDLPADAPRVRLVGSGSILAQVVAARDLLAERFGVAAEVYSAPSFQLLRRDAVVAERWSRLHPGEPPRIPYVTEVLGPDGGPVIAATDWLKAIPDQVARWVPAPFVPLGTDGYGRSDTREALRAFFEVDAASVAYAAVRALEDAGSLPAGTAARALGELGIDADKEDPLAL
ncbi:MAG: pyruvate dehydrogenase (acetyl-transferring), homodimeric type [Chloroflexi bacterium]|jgi:pyruvate dehydrogenase E1 component|nr:pyruvate dehydrogenase (acetyl-transferring), homodimeric type [Chloroflexota bacterium]